MGILLDDLSDHLSVYFRFNAQYNYVKNYHDSGGDVIKLNFKKENCNNFYAVLKETEWFGLLNSEYDSYGNLVYYKDVNLAYNAFQTNFTRIYNSAFTANVRHNLHSCKRGKNNNQAPWITPEIIFDCKLKSKLLKFTEDLKIMYLTLNIRYLQSV